MQSRHSLDARFLAFLLSVLIATSLGCTAPPAAPQRPSVLLITIDALRADRLSCYGYQQRQTPHFDALARGGAVFERAVCDVPWTTGSMASVLTGRYAPYHQVRLSTERLRDEAVTLAEVLRAQRYTTGAIVGSFPLASIYNLNQGFQTYDDEFDTPMDPLTPGVPLTDMSGRPRRIKKIPPLLTAEPEAMQKYFAEKVANDAYRPDNEVTDRAAAWLQEHRNEEFFLWVHYFGPHERVNLFETWQQQSPRVIADYDRDLAFTDTHLGRLLEAIDQMGLRERLLVVLHADHGQSLGENAYVGHGDNLYQPTLRIPLMMRLPGRIPAGVRVSQLAQNVDIFPTVLGLVGIQTDLPLSGADLSPQQLSGAAAAGEREAYSETLLSSFEPHQVTAPEYGAMTVRLARYGLLRGDRMYVVSRFRPPCARADGSVVPDAECEKLSLEELFAPFTDPSGLHNLAATEGAALSRFRAQVASHEQATGPGAERMELSPSERERLRALGYTTH